CPKADNETEKGRLGSEIGPGNNWLVGLSSKNGSSPLKSGNRYLFSDSLAFSLSSQRFSG
ncbi:MAG TPA: hypothetical protein VL380_08770, partial [Nitrosospira sp.]|nr:hypothetical protein [Nitrosospira sp.]